MRSRAHRLRSRSSILGGRTSSKPRAPPPGPRDRIHPVTASYTGDAGSSPASGTLTPGETVLPTPAAGGLTPLTPGSHHGYPRHAGGVWRRRAGPGCEAGGARERRGARVRGGGGGVECDGHPAHIQSGYLTVWLRGGAARPTVSNLNFSAGETVPNLVIAPVGVRRQGGLLQRLGWHRAGPRRRLGMVRLGHCRRRWPDSAHPSSHPRHSQRHRRHQRPGGIGSLDQPERRGRRWRTGLRCERRRAQRHRPPAQRQRPPHRLSRRCQRAEHLQPQLRCRPNHPQPGGSQGRCLWQSGLPQWLGRHHPTSSRHHPVGSRPATPAPGGIRSLAAGAVVGHPLHTGVAGAGRSRPRPCPRPSTGHGGVPALRGWRQWS